jgi:hypothetical protein
MSVPTSKLELLAVLRTEREKWEWFLRQFGEKQMSAEPVEDDWSIKDIIVYITFREHMAGTRLYGELNGTPATIFDLYGEGDLPMGFEDFEPDEQHRWLVNQSRKYSLMTILDEARRAFRILIAAVEKCPESAFVGSDHFPWTEGKSLMEYFPEHSYQLYREHARGIQLWLETYQQSVTVVL